MIHNRRPLLVDRHSSGTSLKQSMVDRFCQRVVVPEEFPATALAVDAARRAGSTELTLHPGGNHGYSFGRHRAGFHRGHH